MKTDRLLEVSSLTRRFGGLIAVNDVSFDVKAGEIFGIIGPNGAGKTTLFNVIAGRYRPSSGRVVFGSRDISGLSSDRIGRLGVARTFQAVHIFKDRTVRENLAYARNLARFHNPIRYFARHQGEESVTIDEVARIAGLDSVLESTAKNLAYGLQKNLGVGMALTVSPKLLLMDEPAAGLNSQEKLAAGLLIRNLRDRGMTIVLVEHDMPLVMDICDRILVVNQGRPIAIGTPGDIRTNPAVIDAYLGEEYEFA